MKIDSLNTFKYNITSGNFKGMNQQEENHASAFRAFEPLMPVPLSTSKAYFSPLITKGYREIETYKLSDVKESKFFELANGHKVLVFQKSGPLVINTAVKTDNELKNPVRHMVEHLIYKNRNQIGTDTFVDIKRDLALKTEAKSSPFRSNYSIKYSFDDRKDIEKILYTQAKLLLNADLNKYFEEEKKILYAESILNQAEKDQDPDKKNNLLNSLTKNEKSIELITLKEAQNYYDKYYKNSNMVTVISSEMKPDEIIKLVSKYFIKPGEKIYEPSQIQELNVNPKDSIREYLTSLDNENSTQKFDLTSDIKTQAQKALIGLKNAKLLAEITAENIIKYGKPVILSYPKILTEDIVAKSLSDTSNSSFGINKKNVDISSIKEYKYSNNLSLLMDTTKNSDTTAMHYILKTDKPIATKPGANEILSCIMSLTLNKNHKNSDHLITDNSFASNNCLKISTVCLPNHTLQTIQDAKNALFFPEMTKENFDLALKMTKQRFLNNRQQVNLKRQSIMQNDENKFTGFIPLETPVDVAMTSYDKITLEDIKQIHSRFLSDSKGEVLISLPESVLESNRTNMFTAIGSNVPILKAFADSNLITKPIDISIPKKNFVIKSLINSDNAKILMDFKIPHTNDLKEKAGLKILETIIGGEDYSRLFYQLREQENLVYNANSVLENHETYTNLSLIGNVATNDTNCSNLQKVCKCFTDNINDLRKNLVKEEELKGAKLTLKSYIADSQESCATRYNKIDEFGTSGLQNIYKVIDNITAQDIQKLAQKYLNNCIWTIEASKEAFDLNSEHLKKLEDGQLA